MILPVLLLVAADSNAAACTDINSASSAALQSVTGIGPAKAQAVLDHIQSNGPFSSIDDVTRVRGIGPATLRNIRDAGFCVDGDPQPQSETPTPAASKPATASGNGCTDINSASSAALESVTGIGPAKAQAVLEYIQSNGPFSSIDDVTRVRGIGPATLRNIRDAGFCVQ